ncbi:MAG: DUF3793 family protein [Treponemataceae bacterium]|nr:DUF3793 family protein [Treponemataceae bacterium]
MSFDELIVRHCSPTLTGIKPSNLVTINCSDCPNAMAEIKLLNENLNESRIYFQFIKCLRNNQILVLVYNKSNLGNHIFHDEQKNFLKELGYPVEKGFNATLSELEKRFDASSSVPHEIGLFLGYPLSDVKGFIENKGSNFKYSGRWKVYGDTEYAKSLFAKYGECEKKCLNRYRHGTSIQQLCQNA